MPRRRSNVLIDLRPLRQFRSQIAADLTGTGNGPAAKAVQVRWVDRYLKFLRTRFMANSAGGGSWPPLSPATIARDVSAGTRRKGILNVTSAIYSALFRGRPGNLIVRLRNGVRVGIGGPARHPKAKTTIGRLARRHDKGDPGRNLPARPIVLPPDDAVRAGMAKDLIAGVRDVARRVAVAAGGLTRRLRRV